MSVITLRDVALSEKAAEKIDLYCSKVRRFEASYLGVEWLLARNPTPPFSLGSSYHGKNWRVLRVQQDPVAKTPEFWLVYHYSEDKVTIEDIEVVG